MSELEDEDINVYKVLTRTKTDYWSTSPVSYIPSPSSEEHAVGYVARFFAKKANDKNAPIIEIDEGNFNLLDKNPFYNMVSMSWKISGALTTLIRDGIEYEQGVSEHNYFQIKHANKSLSGMHDKLRDVYQFYKLS